MRTARLAALHAHLSLQALDGEVLNLRGLGLHPRLAPLLLSCRPALLLALELRHPALLELADGALLLLTRALNQRPHTCARTPCWLHGQTRAQRVRQLYAIRVWHALCAQRLVLLAPPAIGPTWSWSESSATRRVSTSLSASSRSTNARWRATAASYSARWVASISCSRPSDSSSMVRWPCCSASTSCKKGSGSTGHRMCAEAGDAQSDPIVPFCDKTPLSRLLLINGAGGRPHPHTCCRS
jgi:hypothetical protein